eukprot:jgi/Tetstr1/461608/TSEL_006708.t1
MQAGENFHDAAGRRFGVSVNGVEAYVTYELDTAAKTLDLQHTFTPPELRGQGLAGQVVKLAFDYARENGLKVIPTCSYIPVFVKRNPEWIRFTLMQRRACVVSASLRDNRKGAPHVTTCLAGSQAAMLAVGMAFGVGALPIGAAEAKPLFAIAIKELGGETVGLSIEKSEDGSIQVKQLPMDAAPEVKTVAEEVPAEESAVATEVEQDVVVVAAEVESTEEEAAPAVAEVLPEPDVVEVVAEVEPAEQEPPTAIAEVVPEPEAIEVVAEAESTGQEAQAAGAEVVEPAAVVVAELEPNVEETAPSVADLATPEAAVAVSEVKPVDQANLPVVAELVDESDNSGSLILVGGEMAEGEAQVEVAEE